MSWASLFLARGLEDIIVDPRDEAEGEMLEFIERAWPNLKALGLTNGRSASQPGFVSDPCELSNIDFVQECGPDRIEIKRKIVAQLESTIANDIVIASSSSSLVSTDIQKGANGRFDTVN